MSNESTPPAVVPPSEPPAEQDRSLAAITALSALLGWVTGIGFLAPLLCWVMFRDRDELCDEVGRVQSNFQLSWFIWGIVLTIVAVIFSIVTMGIGLLLVVPLVGVFYVVSTVFVVISGVKASNGIVYRPPLRIQFFAEDPSR